MSTDDSISSQVPTVVPLRPNVEVTSKSTGSEQQSNEADLEEVFEQSQVSSASTNEGVPLPVHGRQQGGGGWSQGGRIAPFLEFKKM